MFEMEVITESEFTAKKKAIFNAL
ncbi:MAG TPA: hypothetical protein EYG92_06335 [Lutibacter sp.]|nr:hypothetical protein [Lutibacter sp.]